VTRADIGLQATTANHQPIERQWAWALGWGFLLLLMWDVWGFDLQLARWYGNADGFIWRDHPLLSGVLHDQIRRVGWLVLLGLTVWAAWPVGVGRSWLRTDRWSLIAAIALSLLWVVVIKRFSMTSCPWDLAEFGGVALYVSHWQWGVADGGGGHCFPGGHVSTAFGFLALPLWCWRRAPVCARILLVLILLLGLGLGWVQQMRGAHYLSHNLWTAWLCAATAWVVMRLSTRMEPTIHNDFGVCEFPEGALSPPPTLMELTINNDKNDSKK
jgi:membrane-associated PAP2 superfamily phosphatase